MELELRMPLDMKMLRMVVGVLCGALAVSALALAGSALMLGDKPKWPLFGMELVTLVASVLGVQLALGKLRGAPALALACVAGSIFVATVLGYIGASKQLDLRGGKAPISLKPLLLARVAATALIGYVAMYSNVRRDPKAMSLFWRGVAWAMPMVLMAAAYWKFRVRLGGMGEGTLLACATVAGLVVLCALPAAGHYFIRAFETGASKPDAGEATS